jgi:hypothetical protein
MIHLQLDAHVVKHLILASLVVKLADHGGRAV